MACGGCDSSMGLKKDQIENLITELIRKGTIQGGLHSCGGEKLPAGSAVLLCSQLVDMIKEKVKDGSLPFVTDLRHEGNNLTWKVNGESKSLNLKDLVKDALKLGNTIKEGIITSGVFDVDTKAIAGKGLKSNDETHKLDMDMKGVLQRGSGISVDEQGRIKVDMGSLVDNKTVKYDPSTGKITAVNPAPIKVTNLNNIRGLGTTYFTGDVCNTDGRSVFVTGVPTNAFPETTAILVPSANTLTDLAANQCYDFNGMQIASEGEVHQVFYQGNNSWTRSFDAGMNADGTFKTGEWSQWRRDDNVAGVPIDGFMDLKNRLASIERQLSSPCTANVKTLTSNYTPTKTDEMLIFSGGQTVTFGGDVPVGKQWTIINDSNNVLTLAASGAEIIPPYKGSLKVKGKNAVVTVVKTAANQFRVFGQTEA